MRFDDTKITEMLVRENYVTKEDIVRAEKSAKTARSSIIEQLLISGLVTKDLIGQAVAESFGVLYADLNSNQPICEQIMKIPEETARKCKVVLFAENKKGITVATDNPSQKELRAILQVIFPKQKITIAYSLLDDIEACFSYYRKSLETRFSKIIETQTRVAPEIIEQIIADAQSFHASDIHFEPQGKEVLVRFRVDGVLQEAGRIPREHYENILNRIKVQSRMRIDEHFTAQDGAMRHDKDGTIVDMRVSVVPTVEGEKIALRILASYIQGLSLADLGISHAHQSILEEAVKKPFGMILVTGPTGSGKTTTLYAFLKILNQPDVNIMTIEDPVEYKMLGVNQIQVNPETNLVFARGLRSIVRQDPDVILVGEIRDEETAEIAVNAALTGHLLLSTFHANDAATTIPRLLDMNIEPFLLASTLEVIVAQRLVRKICEQCRHSTTVAPSNLVMPPKVASKFFGKKAVILYQGKGCPMCGGTGYKGRIALFECIQVTPEMQDLILTRPSTQEIWRLACEQGVVSLFEDGIEKVKNGITTLEELKRVAEVPKL
ncbi:MAG: hypothetical protein A3H59_01885 [Candidatus Jacksonbacteria bacterium RIFCSPLOWO2_02_FULL_43_9]|nr:MAG: Type II secretion system protein E [Parcubacteria group bacterium GW2011_GWA2_43_13]OGY71274.1 MAG: hypothetical protein A2986_04185 [Candidatus Jacksonbacteria bacterium RIFCSPLOWO2_01_FULL_44_13]OGY73366.1 MAG: hypothetical protein A3H59_01885 [Candidatus Jacksonbacteria bacterium RIFCSPLOWO2_02_FULL_43_9]HAZ17129.1 hypothetical protein [Candidatus Jacksonbacteria bacterium]